VSGEEPGRLEGSRFIASQLCRFATGGSRELPSVFARRHGFRGGPRTPPTMANHGRFPGAACCNPAELPRDKAAPLPGSQSAARAALLASDHKLFEAAA
jgi:hypothetical protein